MAAYARALKIAPTDAAAHAGLARGYEASHDLAKAKQHAEAALKSDANNEIARIALAQALMREKDAPGAEAAATAIVTNRGASATNAALAWGIIGDARDRRGDAHAAFAAYTSANQILLKQNAALLNASHLLYHPDGVARMSALVEASDVTAWRPAAASAFLAPVFLVGFPRSGTTPRTSNRLLLAYSTGTRSALWAPPSPGTGSMSVSYSPRSTSVLLFCLK